ncbi:TPA: hypothetical protein I0H39_RS13180 [Enterococcus faecalis]|nr:hypothetical protein [Enterococcus faecalis]HBI2011564.1 hypothetical protein [Enterococcus faecalis]HBI2023729.1 hypothetical protein [Enterococcus faecalis]HBI2030281.1 hypothetical protein [Enterococcus faecalis]
MLCTNQKYSRVEVFHGPDLDRVVDKAVETCPTGYLVYDLDVKFLNAEYVVIAKIQKEEP